MSVRIRLLRALAKYNKNYIRFHIGFDVLMAIERRSAIQQTPVDQSKCEI